MQQVASALGRALFGGAGQPVTRGGMDLSAGGQVNINSIYDLVGVKVRATVNGTSLTLDSPWGDDPGEMRGYLPKLMEELSVKSTTYIEGRVNVNEAPREILMSIPNMTEELADGIVAGQMMSSTGESLAGQNSDRATSAWIYYNGLVDLAQLRQLDPYITTRGDVFRMQSVGYFETGGPFARVEALIDATFERPRILFQRDLTDLGRGYSPALLRGKN